MRREGTIPAPLLPIPGGGGGELTGNGFNQGELDGLNTVFGMFRVMNNGRN